MGSVMKRCAYCIDDVNDQAMVCRSCGRTCLEGCAQLMYIGAGWVLGQTDRQTLGIWNVISGGALTEEFEASDKGHRKASNRVDALQRQGGTSFGVGVLF
jgi:hypothetical protein